MQRNVQEHTNAHGVRFGDRLRQLREDVLLAHGSRLGPSSSIAQQLIRERLGGSHWKRAVLLDRLQWDVFRRYYQSLEARVLDLLPR